MTAILNWVRWNLNVILMNISFMAKDIEHFFFNLLAAMKYYEGNL
jgi:hypothetical protein